VGRRPRRRGWPFEIAPSGRTSLLHLKAAAPDLQGGLLDLAKGGRHGASGAWGARLLFGAWQSLTTLPAPRSWSRSAGNVPQREPRGNGPGTGGGSEGPDGPLVDAYHSSAFQVFFDGSDRVEFVELSRSDEIEARYDGVPVLALPAWEAIEYMTTKAPSILMTRSSASPTSSPPWKRRSGVPRTTTRNLREEPS